MCERVFTLSKCRPAMHSPQASGTNATPFVCLICTLAPYFTFIFFVEIDKPVLLGALIFSSKVPVQRHVPLTGHTACHFCSNEAFKSTLSCVISSLRLLNTPALLVIASYLLSSNVHKDKPGYVSGPCGHQRDRAWDPISINYPDDEARKHAC